jgi:hypothetical protein
MRIKSGGAAFVRLQERWDRIRGAKVPYGRLVNATSETSRQLREYAEDLSRRENALQQRLSSYTQVPPEAIQAREAINLSPEIRQRVKKTREKPLGGL